jgi:archaetidylinositol phosphate synthase
MSTRYQVYGGETHVDQSSGDGFVCAIRVHKSLTAEFEKRVLIWMAKRTPSRINPDHLTALGFTSQVLAGAAYALAHHNPAALWVANFFLILNWLGDSLDGTLARVRDQQRPRFGFYVDHMADTFGALALMGGLAFSGYLHWQTAVGMLVCFYVLSIESYLATYSLGRFHLSHGIFGPTEIRVLLLVGNIIAVGHRYAHLGGYSCLLFDLGGWAAIIGMSVMAIASTFQHTRLLYQDETPR